MILRFGTFFTIHSKIYTDKKRNLDFIYMGKTLFDQYTYLHFAVGIVAYFWHMPLSIWFLVHTLFEFLENTTIGMSFINQYVTIWPGGKHYSDSYSNNLGDTFAAIIGWLSAALIASR